MTYGSGGSGPYSVAVADGNGDGMPDLLVANCGALYNVRDCGGGGNVGVLINSRRYKAFAQPPINPDSSGVFSGKRGVVPVKFTSRRTTRRSAPCKEIGRSPLHMTASERVSISKAEKQELAADTASTRRPHVFCGPDQ